MKLDLAQRSTQAFLAALAVIALSINWYFWSHSPFRQPQPLFISTSPPEVPVSQSSGTPRQAAGPAAPTSADATQGNSGTPTPRQTEVSAAQTQAQYVARYVKSGVERTAGRQMVAVAVSSEDRKLERTVSGALARHFKADKVDIVGSMFEPEFVSDGLLSDLLAESTKVMTSLGLDKTLDGLILAEESVEYSTNPSLENVITADMSLNILVQATSGNGGSQKWTLVAKGAGFDRKAARMMAEERILKQIDTDTKMSLNPILAAKKAL